MRSRWQRALVALLAVAVISPVLGVAEVCRVNMPTGDSMTCCRAMAERCMHHDRDATPMRDGACCRHNASAPMFVALLNAHHRASAVDEQGVASAPADVVAKLAVLPPQQRLRIAETPPPLPLTPDRLRTVWLI